MSGAFYCTWGGHFKVKPLEWYYARIVSRQDIALDEP